MSAVRSNTAYNLKRALLLIAMAGTLAVNFYELSKDRREHDRVRRIEIEEDRKLNENLQLQERRAEESAAASQARH